MIFLKEKNNSVILRLDRRIQEANRHIIFRWILRLDRRMTKYLLMVYLSPVYTGGVRACPALDAGGGHAFIPDRHASLFKLGRVFLVPV